MALRAAPIRDCHDRAAHVLSRVRMTHSRSARRAAHSRAIASRRVASARDASAGSGYEHGSGHPCAHLGGSQNGESLEGTNCHPLHAGNSRNEHAVCACEQSSLVLPLYPPRKIIWQIGRHPVFEYGRPLLQEGHHPLLGVSGTTTRIHAAAFNLVGFHRIVGA